MTEHYDCNSNLWNCTSLRMSAGAHFSQHGMATYSTMTTVGMTRPNMTQAMPYALHTTAQHNTCYAKWGRGHYTLHKMGQRTWQTTHKGTGHDTPHIKRARDITPHIKRAWVGHYTPHKNRAWDVAQHKRTKGIFYATLETNNRTLNTQQNKKLVYNKLDFDEIHRNIQEIYREVRTSYPQLLPIQGWSVHCAQSPWTSLTTPITGGNCACFPIAALTSTVHHPPSPRPSPRPAYDETRGGQDSQYRITILCVKS